MNALFETPPPYSTDSGRSSVDLKDKWRNMCKAADQQGLADTARHVIETHCEPSSLELYGIL